MLARKPFEMYACIWEVRLGACHKACSAQVNPSGSRAAFGWQAASTAEAEPCVGLCPAASDAAATAAAEVAAAESDAAASAVRFVAAFVAVSPADGAEAV